MELALEKHIHFIWNMYWAMIVGHLIWSDPKKKQTLPTVLAQSEALSILKVTRNLKHKALLTCIYSVGLRISEVLRFKPSDIDSANMRIWVRDAKGAKDRITLLSPHLLTVLRAYYQAFQPKTFLFEGQQGGRYSATSVRKVLARSAQRAGVSKKICVHILTP